MVAAEEGRWLRKEQQDPATISHQKKYGFGISGLDFKKKLAKALRTQTKQDTELIELKKQVRDLTDRLRSKCAQIADNDEERNELFALRTENASLTDRLFRARCVCQGGSGVRRCQKPARLPKVIVDSD